MLLLKIADDDLEAFFDSLLRKMLTSSWSKNLTYSLVKLCENAQQDIKRES